jgi:hypothetical protein
LQEPFAKPLADELGNQAELDQFNRVQLVSQRSFHAAFFSGNG